MRFPFSWEQLDNAVFAAKARIQKETIQVGKCGDCFCRLIGIAMTRIIVLGTQYERDYGEISTTEVYAFGD